MMPSAYTKVLPLDDVNGLVAGRHGYFIANKFDAYIGLGLIRYGEYAKLEWDLLSRLIKPGENVAEVGANIGAHTVSLAKAVGPGAWVIAVEPQRIIHQYLCANLALNGLLNVEAHLAGCGAEPGEMTPGLR